MDSSSFIACVRCSLIVALSALTASCASVISGVTGKLGEDLAATVLASDDLEVVATGLPSYLLLVDALVERNPDDPSLLRAAALLNGSYATAFVREEERQKLFTLKGKQLALKAICQHRAQYCELKTTTFDEFVEILATASISDIEFLYVLATNWAGWIQANAEDFSAVAELARAKLLVEKVIELDSNYGRGSPYIYMGVFALLLPAALGGEPEVGRVHLENAFEISEGQNLYAKTMLASMYARGVFNRALHDQLVEEVLAADPVAGDLTLQNVLAQQLAQELKDTAHDFF